MKRTILLSALGAVGIMAVSGGCGGSHPYVPVVTGVGPVGPVQGARVIYVRPDLTPCQIHSAKPDGTNDVIVGTFPKLVPGAYQAFTSDGKRIAYGSTSSSLVISDLAGTNAVTYAGPADSRVSPWVFSPDNTKLAVIVQPIGGGVNTVVVSALTGAQLGSVENNDLEGWYSDSAQLLCDGKNGQGAGIYDLVSYATGIATPTPLADLGSPFVQTYGFVAPNGSIVATELGANVGTDPTTIHLFNVNTGSDTVIASEPVLTGNGSSAWASSGLALDNATTLLVQTGSLAPNNFAKFYTVSFAGKVTPLFTVNSSSATVSAVGGSVYVP